MADDRDPKEDPTEELKQGLTHLWRAARGMATGVKKEVERTDFGKEISGAGRELVRAASNVVDRIAGEVSNMTTAKPGARHDGGQPPQPPTAPAVNGDEDDEFDGVKPKGSTNQDPGFRIADETKKKDG
jgi:hypothetical protein